MSEARREFRAGVRSLLPLQLGVIPFGMMTGVVGVNIGLSPFEAIAMSWIVFAGASQLVAMQLMDEGAPLLVIVASAAIVNLRFVMYSASIAPHFRPLPTRWKFLLGYILTDQAYAVSINRYNEPGEVRHRHWFFFGGAASMWVTWQIATVAGALLGQAVPRSWSLDFVIPIMFMAIMMPNLKDKASVTAALVGGGVAVAGIGLPLNLGLIVGAFAGILAGMMVEARTQ